MKTKIIFRCFAVLLLLTCSMCFTACGNSLNSGIYEIEAIALNEDGGVLLFYTLNGINSSLVSANTQNAELTTSNGVKINQNDFKTGQLVTIKYNGSIAESYPGQILLCYGIRITGEADLDKTTEALNKYVAVFTIESTVYYIDELGEITSKTVPVIYGDYFGEWRKANGIPENVRLLEMTMEDNAYEETDGEAVTYYSATIMDFHLDLSEDFLIYLTSAEDERMVVMTLVKSIIGENPAAKDTAVFITVAGNPLKTEKNDFSGRLSFNF